MSHVLVISHDVVGAQMAGPGIRYYNLARTLAREFQVVLAMPGEYSLQPSTEFDALGYRSGEDPALVQAVQDARTVIVPAVSLASFPSLLHSSVPLVVDGYDPFIAETLFLDQNAVAHLRRVLAYAYLAGDFFICASERQRDWWLGLLEAHGRVNSYTFRDDVSMRRLIDVVPFGMPNSRPEATCAVLRERWPGIHSRDKVILWGGGLWSWLDPLTAIRAMAHVRDSRSDVRLVFPGTRHPNPNMSDVYVWTDKAKALAQKLGLVDQVVFFGDWIPYQDWPSVLLESDVALSLHYDTLETRLAFRTRILDYMWAGLPMVVTCGDEMSQLVERYELGTVVGYEDTEAVTGALLRLLDLPRTSFEGRFGLVREQLTWDQAARPLIEFCRCPRRAPDKAALGGGNENLFCLTEIERLRKLVTGYERGRFIRFTKWLHRMKERLVGARR